jgi:hypothetical protein
LMEERVAAIDENQRIGLAIVVRKIHPIVLWWPVVMVLPGSRPRPG